MGFENIDAFMKQQEEIQRRIDAWEEIWETLLSNSKIGSTVIRDLKSYIVLQESTRELANFAERMDDYGGDVVLGQLLKKWGDIWAWLLSFFKFRKHIKLNQFSSKQKWQIYQPILFDYFLNVATNKFKSWANQIASWATWAIADAWIDQMSKANKIGADVFDEALKDLEEKLKYRGLKPEDINMPYLTIEKIQNGQIDYLHDLPKYYRQKKNVKR